MNEFGNRNGLEAVFPGESFIEIQKKITPVVFVMLPGILTVQYYGYKARLCPWALCF